MKFVRRRLFTTASLLSLSLLLLTAGLLAYAAFVDPFADLRIVGRSRTYGVSQWKGSIRLQVVGPFPSGYPGNQNILWGGDPRVPGRTLGFSLTTGPCRTGDPPVRVPLTFVQVPWAFPILVFAVLPLVALCRVIVQRSRRRAGRLSAGRAGFEVMPPRDAA